MKPSTKLKNQLKDARKWSNISRKHNKERFLEDVGLLYMQVAIEQIIKYLEMKAENNE